MPLRRPQSRTIFIFVGAVGFCIDGGILSLALAQGYSAAVARGFSFSLAVMVTFVLNSTLTFRVPRRPNKARFIQYWLVQVGGAGINFALFLLLVYWVPAWQKLPILPLVPAALASLAFTYSLSRIIFQEGTHEP